MKFPRFSRILLEEGARDYEMTRRILARLQAVPVEVIQDREALKGAGRPPTRLFILLNTPQAHAPTAHGSLKRNHRPGIHGGKHQQPKGAMDQ